MLNLHKTNIKNKKQLIIFICILVLICLLVVFSFFLLKIQKERQAIVDYYRSTAEIIPLSSVTYKGYSFEHRMDKFVVSYEAQNDSFPRTEDTFYVENDEQFSVYHVFAEEELISDPFDGEVMGFMIADDASALDFADQLILNVDKSFSCEAYPHTDVNFHEAKQYYTVSRSNDTQSGYAMELWVHENNKLYIKSVYINQQPIFSAFVKNEEEARKLADIIFFTAYSDVQYIYPDITVEVNEDKEWFVIRSDKEGGSNSAYMSVKISSDGDVFELIWGIK